MKRHDLFVVIVAVIFCAVCFIACAFNEDSSPEREPIEPTAQIRDLEASDSEYDAKLHFEYSTLLDEYGALTIEVSRKMSLIDSFIDSECEIREFVSSNATDVWNYVARNREDDNGLSYIEVEVQLFNDEDSRIFKIEATSCDSTRKDYSLEQIDQLRLKVDDLDELNSVLGRELLNLMKVRDNNLLALICSAQDGEFTNWNWEYARIQSDNDGNEYVVTRDRRLRIPVENVEQVIDQLTIDELQDISVYYNEYQESISGWDEISKYLNDHT